MIDNAEWQTMGYDRKCRMTDNRGWQTMWIIYNGNWQVMGRIPYIWWRKTMWNSRPEGMADNGKLITYNMIIRQWRMNDNAIWQTMVNNIMGNGIQWEIIDKGNCKQREEPNKW